MLISGEEDDHANKAVLPAAMWTARDSNNIHGDSIIDNDVAAVGGYRTYSCDTIYGVSDPTVKIWREASRERSDFLNPDMMMK